MNERVLSAKILFWEKNCSFLAILKGLNLFIALALCIAASLNSNSYVVFRHLSVNYVKADKFPMGHRDCCFSRFVSFTLAFLLAIYSISSFLSAPYCASLVCFPAYLQSVNTSSLVLLAIDLVSPLQSSQCTHANPAFDTTPPPSCTHTCSPELVF